MVERSLISFVIIMSAMAYVTRAWHVFALRAVQGVFAGYGGLTLAMAAESAPRDRMARAIGLVQTAQRLGPALGPVIGGVVAEMVGIRRAFFVTAGFYAAALAVVFLLYRDPVRDGARRGGSGVGRAAMSGSCSGAGVPADDGVHLRHDVRRSQLRADPAALPGGRGTRRRAGGAALGRAVLGGGGRRGRRQPRVRVAARAGGPGRGSSRPARARRPLGLAWFLSTSNDVAMGSALLVFGAGAGAAITAAYTVGGRAVPARRMPPDSGSSREPRWRASR